ncbi:MAG: hypothetical protein HQK94_18970 [Nitrospirae bacterium]|nr:hypothetical protein [Nitrospirota bacterium]
MENKEVVLEADLNEVLERFKQWRLAKSKREPIPGDLWDAAVSLTKRYSVNQVSRVLHVSYAKLRQRVGGKQSQVETPFMEIGLGQMVSPVRCVVEIEKADGSTLKICFTGEGAQEILGIGKAFCGNN